MADDWGRAPDGRQREGSAHQRHPNLFEPTTPDHHLFIAERGLADTKPDASCSSGLTCAQIRLARQAFTVLALAALITPQLLFQFWALLSWGIFAAVIALRSVLALVGAVAHTGGRLHDGLDAQSGLKRQIWPTYTVLAAIYREPVAVKDLVASLKGLDYPKRQLDVILLLEEGDEATLDALQVIALPSNFRIICVPPGEIQTKPRALNYGLQFAQGQYVCVYDAEDRIRSDQIKAAVRAFQRDRESRFAQPLACLQSPLVPHNGNESWISGQFALEYSVQFGLIVPGLTLLDLPVPLGGTSNHFDRKLLEAVGGWDPYNVTEDADIGFRLAQEGYRVKCIIPPTYEEAPVSIPAWVRQRSRWIKGFLQTLGVILRNPQMSIERMGGLRFGCSVLTLGGSVLSALAYAPLTVYLFVSIVLPGLEVPESALWLMAAGMLSHLVASFLSHGIWRPGGLVATVTAPLYWPLHTWAAAKAIHSLITQPFYWEKTEHGLSRDTLAPEFLKVV